jgi:hypothetical protein
MDGIRRSILRALVAGMLTGGMTLVATGLPAQAVPELKPTIGVVPVVGRPGSWITVTGIGFKCGGPVALHLRYPKQLAMWYLGSATPGAGVGDFTAFVRIPRGAQLAAGQILAAQGGCTDDAKFFVCSTCLGDARMEGRPTAA